MCLYVYCCSLMFIACLLMCFSPHLCVGFLFLILYPAPPGPAPSADITHSLSHTTFHTQLCHTLFHTHNFVTHHLSHTTLSYTLFRTQLCHTPSFTHNLSHTVFHTHTHTSLSHTIFHTQLCHTPSFTHIFVTHHLSHTTLSHTISHRPPFCLAGVAHMALGWLWWRAWSPLVARGAAALCVAGVAPGDIYRRFAWQAWRLATSTVLRGMRGTWRHQPWFCVAGVALGNIYANTQTSTQTSFTHTHTPLEHTTLNTHTHTPFKHTPFTHKLEHIHTSRHNAFIHNTHTHNSFTQT